MNKLLYITSTYRNESKHIIVLHFIYLLLIMKFIFKGIIYLNKATFTHPIAFAM